MTDSGDGQLSDDGPCATFDQARISGLAIGGKAEQRTTCPRCSLDRSKSNERCLAVNVYKGVWDCKHCGWSGALRQESERASKGYTPKLAHTVPPAEKMYQFFEARGIPRAVVDRNKIRSTTRKIDGKDMSAIVFGFYENGMLVNEKYRTGNKRFQQSQGGKPVLYKLDDLIGQSECICVEGEMDALSFEAAGMMNAVSVPSGAPPIGAKNFDTYFAFLKHCAPTMAAMNRVYLATDADAPGLNLREELARRLGKGRCYVVEFPAGCKDANEVLMRHGAAALRKIIEDAEPFPIEGIIDVKSQSGELDSLYEYGFPHGARTGIAELDERIQWHPGQLTVVTGVPTHGKSGLMDFIAVKLAVNANWKVAYFSPENWPTSAHIIRLVEIVVGKPFLPNYNGRMSRAEYREAVDWVHDRFYFVRPADTGFTLERIHECFAYLNAVYGVEMGVLDPWNTLEHQMGAGMSETNYIGKALNTGKLFARNHGMHEVIIAHPTKVRKQPLSNLYEIPTAYDIAGSANFFNVPDNIITVYRQYDEELTRSYTKVLVQKIKHKFYGSPGVVEFDFHVSNQRYYKHGGRPDLVSELDRIKEIDKYVQEGDMPAHQNGTLSEAPF